MKLNISWRFCSNVCFVAGVIQGLTGDAEAGTLFFGIAILARMWYWEELKAKK